MQAAQPAKLLRIHISAGDRWQGRPLYEAIVARCRELKIAGATVFRGLEGYGETAMLHRHHLARADEPILIAVVDSAEAIERLIPAIEPMIDTGLIAVSPVEVIRVQKKSQSGEPPSQ
jgi:PII-like signaling protein